MFIQSEVIMSTIIFILACVGIIMIFLGIVGRWISSEKKEKKLFALVAAIGVILIIGLLYTVVEIHEGNVGVSQNNNWYGPGYHLTLEKIKIVSLKGSIPLWKENLTLLYDLTPEEVMSLNEGSDFQEKLKSMYVYDIDENWNATMTKTSEAPPGFETSHLKLMISF